MTICFRVPNEAEFGLIVNYIAMYELDNRAMKQSQFIAAFDNEHLLGFARLRDHADCIELCSLGVVATYRRKGVGRGLVTELMSATKKRIYLACIIPEFFVPLGFIITQEFPQSMQDKLDYCKHQLVVEETYVVMLHGANNE